jgi:hypothetical protein
MTKRQNYDILIKKEGSGKNGEGQSYSIYANCIAFADNRRWPGHDART